MAGCARRFLDMLLKVVGIKHVSYMGANSCALVEIVIKVTRHKKIRGIQHQAVK